MSSSKNCAENSSTQYRNFGNRGTVPLFFQLSLWGVSLFPLFLSPIHNCTPHSSCGVCHYFFHHVVKMSLQTKYSGFVDFMSKDLKLKADYRGTVCFPDPTRFPDRNSYSSRKK